MQAQIDIKYDQLVQLLRQLPKQQWVKLKKEVEEDDKNTSAKSDDMLAFLLKAPTFSKEQLEEVDKARKEIDQWRTR